MKNLLFLILIVNQLLLIISKNKYKRNRRGLAGFRFQNWSESVQNCWLQKPAQHSIQRFRKPEKPSLTSIWPSDTWTREQQLLAQIWLWPFFFHHLRTEQTWTVRTLYSTDICLIWTSLWFSLCMWESGQPESAKVIVG